MNPDLERLQPYPFERMGRLLAEVAPPHDCEPIALSVGEPRHAPPAAARQALIDHLDGLGQYPPTRGSDALRATIAAWLQRRFPRPAGAQEPAILPVNGTREALFAIAQSVVDRSRARPTVLLPNPCYQIYEGATLLAGAEPHYYPAATTREPDLATVPESVWARCQLLYICNPGNPTGTCLSLETQRALIERARHYGFVIAADECYSEIYPPDGPAPKGLFEAAGNDLGHCIVFHSLSKRSNLPGLRSGFVAGDPVILEAFARYRTYHGCAMPPPAQAASIAAWRDEDHVRENRRAYADKMAACGEIIGTVLPSERPAAGFYLWPEVPGGDDEAFCRELYGATGVRALPGRYLGRSIAGRNPAAGRVRLALVAESAICMEAARRIRRFIEQRHTRPTAEHTAHSRPGAES